MGDLQPKSKSNFVATIVTALISGYVAIQIANINAKGEFQKASLGYEKIAQSVNQIEEHQKAQDKELAKIQGFDEEMSKILQLVFEAQTGKRFIDLPPPNVSTYGELPGRDRPYRRYPIGRRVTLPTPKEASATAVERLKALPKNSPAPLPTTAPLPVRLENIVKSAQD